MFSKIIVHAGIFHCDDVLTVAMAKYINPNVEIERVYEVNGDLCDDVIVADIGYGRYDHHQNDAQLREDGNKYAACGLFFKDYWHHIFQSENSARGFYEYFIKPIEDNDNGLKRDTLSMFVKSFVPLDANETKLHDAFLKVVDMMVQFIDSQVEKEKAKLESKAYIKESLKQSQNHIVVLEKLVPWKDQLIYSDAKYVIYPSLRGGWNLQCVPQIPGNYEVKEKLPERWLFDKPKGCIFVHNMRFLASFHSFHDAYQAIIKERQQNRLSR